MPNPTPTAQPTITSAHLPKPAPGAVAPVVDVPVPDDQIEAKPLNSTGNFFLALKPKNPNIVFRGINFRVGTNESGLRYEEALSQGYENATLADCAPPVSKAFIRDNGARIVYGDLILMKIGRSAYLGALKLKDQKAAALTSRTAVKATAREHAKQNISAPPDQLSKVSIFTPSDVETEALAGKDDK